MDDNQKFNGKVKYILAALPLPLPITCQTLEPQRCNTSMAKLQKCNSLLASLIISLIISLLPSLVTSQQPLRRVPGVSA